MQKLEFSNGNHDGPRRAVAVVGVSYEVDGPRGPPGCRAVTGTVTM